MDEQLQCSNDLLSLITGPPKMKGKRRKRKIKWKENAEREASCEIFRDVQLSDRDVLLSACRCSEQMLNGLIDSNSSSDHSKPDRGEQDSSKKLQIRRRYRSFRNRSIDVGERRR